MSFAVPYGNECEFFGNGYSIQKLSNSIGLKMTSELYVYSDNSSGKYSCDEKKKDLSGDYQELYRLKQYAPGFDCGLHIVLKGIDGPDDEQSDMRKVVVKSAYDGQLGWEAKGVRLQAAIALILFGASSSF